MTDKKNIFIILLVLFCSRNLSAQNSEVENFINSFYKDIVPKNFKYYNLLDESLKVDFDVDYMNESLDDTELINQISHFKISDFEVQNQIINWKSYNLNKAKIYSIEDIPKFKSALYHYIFIDRKMSRKYYDSIIENKKYNQVILRGNLNWSKEKQRRKFEKIRNRQQQKIRIEDQDYFQISSPIFSKDKEYAVVYFRDCCHSEGYLYRFSNNKWEHYLTFYRSISN